MKRFFTQLYPLRKLSIALLTVIAVALTASAFYVGQLKATAQIDWLDLFGEATSSAMALLWFVLLLRCRPQGRLSVLLLIGASSYWLTTWLDLLDEVIAYPPTNHAFTWMESLPAPISMVLLTWGLFHWYQEQQAINRQLQQREYFHREHSLIDPVTQLYSMRYFLIQLRREALLHDKRQLPLSLIAVDVDAFARFNLKFGLTQGDAQLRQLAQALELPLRETDLVCRHASDQFIALLPETLPDEAALLAQQVERCCAEVSHGAATVTATSLTRESGESDQVLIRRLNLKLQSAKQQSAKAGKRVA